MKGGISQPMVVVASIIVMLIAIALFIFLGKTTLTALLSLMEEIYEAFMGILCKATFGLVC